MPARRATLPVAAGVLGGWLLAAFPAPAGAQVPRALLRRDLERDRRNVRAYVEAVPDSVLGFRPTPGVRTFAEQIEHLILDNVNIVGTALSGDSVRWERPARSAYLNSRPALLELVDRGYDVVLELLAGAGDRELVRTGRVFGRYEVPRWRAFEAAREHASWTLAQTVPYLRLNGITPPSYEIFDPSTVRGDPPGIEW